MRNIIKIIIGIGIMDYAVNLLLVLIGYQSKAQSPINPPDQLLKRIVDPVPQAMVMVSIVIGLAVTLILVACAIRIYDKYHTFDITKINQLKR